MKMMTSVLALILGIAILSCSKKNLNEQSHGKSAEPNYTIVFPNDKVNRIDIIIDAEKWAEMQTDLKSNIGSFNGMPTKQAYEQTGNSTNKPQERKNQAAPSSSNTSMIGHPMGSERIPPPHGDRKMGPPPGGRPGGIEYEPVWEYCSVYFNNQEWNKVGIRFKGNSSLRTTYQQGIKKLPFKLDFDQFEDEFPEIKNQRFYGFKQLNLKNNYEDKSFIREKVASDLFADFGLTSAKTSFYQVFVDYGQGPQYFGLYTLVEEVDDTAIETLNKSDKGNLYKPEGIAATFAGGSFRTIDMNKKTNKKSNDYSDVRKLNTIINSSLRLENYELWKSQLSETFDVPVFLKWLAANTVIQNWDSYGRTFHNYYLYNNPESKKLEWISWDNNEAFQMGKMGGALSLSLNEVGERWPLIRYIIDDEDWQNEYKSNVSVFANEVFNADRMPSIYSDYQQLLSNCIVGEHGEIPEYTFLESETDYYEAVEFLKQQVEDRKIVVQKFLGKNYE